MRGTPAGWASAASGAATRLTTPIVPSRALRFTGGRRRPRSAVKPDDTGGRHRAVEALERQLARVLDFDEAFELREHPAGDQDLAGPGFAAESRREVRHCAD